MNRQKAYRQARRLIRDNGMFAVRWLRMSHASIMLRLANQKADPLQEKARDLIYINNMEHAYGCNMYRYELQHGYYFFSKVNTLTYIKRCS